MLSDMFDRLWQESGRSSVHVLCQVHACRLHIHDAVAMQLFVTSIERLTVHLKVVVIRTSNDHVVDLEHHAAELCG